MCFAVLDPLLKYTKLSTDLASMPMEYCRKPREYAWRVLPGKLGFVSAFLMEWYHAHLHINKLIEKVVRFGRMHQVDRVWCILQGQTMIRLALPVAEQLRVPLLTQIWDHPAWWLTANKVDRFSRVGILKAFDRVIQKSAYCGAASFLMAEQFREEYGVKAVPLIASIDPAWAYPPAQNLHDPAQLVLGIAGQLYSKAEWETLLATLASINWTIRNQRVIVRYLGYSLNIGGHQKVHIEFLGYRPQRETITLMSECDLLYCPYPFARNFETIAKSSFPSKLTTYLAAGRPVLFHGPAYASPARFLMEHQAAVLCHSLEKQALIDAISTLIEDSTQYRTYCENGHKAFEKYFTLTALRKNFAAFLQVPEDSLCPCP